VLALGTIGHVVVELEVAVELGLDDDVVQRELINLGSAAKRGSLVLVGTANTTNVLSSSPATKGGA